MPPNNFKELKRRIAKEIANEVFNLSQENIIKMEISDTGALFLSGEVLDKTDYAEIVYSAPHAAPVNNGSKPHKINPEWLEGWVRKKLGVEEAKVKEVAQRIASKISKLGTEPKPFLDNALETFKNSGKIIKL